MLGVIICPRRRAVAVPGCEFPSSMHLVILLRILRGLTVVELDKLRACTRDVECHLSSRGSCHAAIFSYVIYGCDAVFSLPNIPRAEHREMFSAEKCETPKGKLPGMSYKILVYIYIKLTYSHTL